MRFVALRVGSMTRPVRATSGVSISARRGEKIFGKIWKEKIFRHKHLARRQSARKEGKEESVHKLIKLI